MFTEVSFQMSDGEQPLILVPVYVNDAGPYRFILDTGAGICLLSKEIATGLHIEPAETKKGMGAGGTVTVALGRVHSLRIGEARAVNLQAGITDEFRAICPALGSVDGIIGYNFLKDFRLTLDYLSAALRLDWDSEESGGRPDGDVSEAVFRLAHPSKPLILLSVSANGQGPYQFALDTGASATVISAALAKELGISRAPASRMCGAGGQVQGSAGMLESFELGKARSEGLQVVVADFLGPLSRTLGAKLDGIVGYNFLRQFLITIDYPKGIVRLRGLLLHSKIPVQENKNYHTTPS